MDTTGARPAGYGSGGRLSEELEWSGMTQDYIIGEFSLRLMQLQAAASNDESAGEFARLRMEAEAAPIDAMPVIAVRALELVRGLCGGSLARGDLRALTNQATKAAELREFAIAASLLPED